MPTSVVAQNVSLAANRLKPKAQAKTLLTEPNTQDTQSRAKACATLRKTEYTKALQLAGLGGLCGWVDSRAAAAPS